MRAFALLATLVACSGDDPAPDDTGSGDGYVLLGDTENLPASGFLSIWGSSSDDVWIVGSDDGQGPAVLQFDGTDWSRVSTGSAGDLWWVWSAEGSDSVWMVGDGARVLRYDRTAGTVDEQVVSNAAYKLFGVWGTADDNVYAVGGDINRNLPGVILQYDGKTWTEVATAPEGASGTRLAFKVWGTGPDDVWVVGDGALLMHYDGTAWTEVEAPVFETSPLTTVHGHGNEVYAVGGFGNAIVARYDGTEWTDDSPPPTAVAPFFNGVFATAATTVACGGSASIWTREADGWTLDDTALEADGDYHACWIDENGEIWAVGGDLVSLDEGLIVHSGLDVPRISL